MGSKTMGGKHPQTNRSRSKASKQQSQSFQRARTVRRLARRRGWQISQPGIAEGREIVRDPKTGKFPMILRFSCEGER